MIRKVARLFLSLILMSAFIAPAQAGMISTDELLQQGARERLANELQKEQVQQKLVDMGVDPDVALERVRSMTDTEIARLGQRLDTLPAGGHVSNRLLAVLLIIVVLLAL